MGGHLDRMSNSLSLSCLGVRCLARGKERVYAVSLHAHIFSHASVYSTLDHGGYWQDVPVVIVRNKVDKLADDPELGGRSDEELRRQVSSLSIPCVILTSRG